MELKTRNYMGLMSKAFFIGTSTIICVTSFAHAQTHSSGDSAKGLCIDLSVADKSNQTASNCPTNKANTRNQVEAVSGSSPVKVVTPKPQQVVSVKPVAPQAVFSRPVTLTATDGGLNLTLTLSKSTVRLGDSWDIKLQANKSCELQLIYQQSDNAVIDITSDFPQVVGGSALAPGEIRTIPVAEFTGAFKAGLPLGRESIVAQCKVGGLSTDKVDVKLLAENDLGEMPDISKGLFIDLSVASVKNIAEHAVVTMPIEVVK